MIKGPVNSQITALRILKSYRSCDGVVIEFGNIRSGVFPYNGPLRAYFEVGQGNGVDYVQQNFPDIPIYTEDIGKSLRI
jgi:hypothetical protein